MCDAANGEKVDSPFFTLELEHGGIFCGLITNLEYWSPSVEVLDFVDSGTLCYAFLEQHLAWLGYPVSEHIIYFSKPNKPISDGLIRISSDEDVQHMIRASAEHKMLVVMVDHTNFTSNFRSDLVCTSFAAASASPSHSLVSVFVEDPLSEIAANGTDPQSLLIEGAEHNMLTEDGETVIEDVVVSDSDFSDSDYDIDDGDDDLYDDNIDFDVDEEADQDEDDVEPEYLLEDEDLNLSTQQADELRYKFKAFNAKVDMISPVFKVGMVFADVVELRKDLTAYSIRNRVQIKKMK